MLRSKARWEVATPQPEKAVQLGKNTGLSPLAAQVLINRDIESEQQVHDFLHTDESSFHDPYLLKGMQEGVERICQAVEADEHILVFGDYDADGVTSTAIMMRTLAAMGAKVDYYIPNRFTEGYGVNETALQKAKSKGYQLVVTVDTGIAAVEEAELCRHLDLDLIITDHHQPPPELPEAFCIMNPHQDGCKYSYKELSGAGVAFKVAHALLGEVPSHLLDLAALGTIADLVPLTGENRLIAMKGLSAITRTQKPGLRALLRHAGRNNRVVTEEDVGFVLGPRLNAAGRMDSAEPAVRLLLADEESEAVGLAEEVNSLNEQRKHFVRDMAKAAMEDIEAHFTTADDHLFVIAKQGWNPGVIGIVASRIVEQYHRPAIVIGIDDETGAAVGSARSIGGFDMYAHLSDCRDLLLKFGGHPMAAGMTLDPSNIGDLRARLNQQAKQTLRAEDLVPVEAIDLSCRAEDVSLALVEEMQKLAPFGVANAAPKVLIEDTPVTQLKQIGRDKNHLKVVFQGNDASLEGVGFGLGSLYDGISDTAKVSAIGEIQVNEWNGYRKPQLLIRDMAVHEWQLFDLRGGLRWQERLASLPLHKCVFLSFRKETAQCSCFFAWRDRIEWIPDEPQTSRDLRGCYVVLLDLPYRQEQIWGLFADSLMPERIYVVFHQEDTSFVTPPPARSQFKWFYAFLMQRKTFDIGHKADELARVNKISKETILLMASVFSELDFVTHHQGWLSLNESPEKRDLTESESYRQKQQQASVAEDLCYSSFSALKQWFDGIIDKRNQVERAGY